MPLDKKQVLVLLIEERKRWHDDFLASRHLSTTSYFCCGGETSLDTVIDVIDSWPDDEPDSAPQQKAAGDD